MATSENAPELTQDEVRKQLEDGGIRNIDDLIKKISQASGSGNKSGEIRTQASYLLKFIRID